MLRNIKNVSHKEKHYIFSGPQKLLIKYLELVINTKQSWELFYWCFYLMLEGNNNVSSLKFSENKAYSLKLWSLDLLFVSLLSIIWNRSWCLEHYTWTATMNNITILLRCKVGIYNPTVSNILQKQSNRGEIWFTSHKLLSYMIALRLNLII